MNRKVVLYSMLLLLAVFGAACKSVNQVTPAEWDDAAIEAEVRAKLAEDIDTKSLGIEVKVNDGVVTLDGHVDNNDQRAKAGAAAGDVKGVKRVVNNIHVG